MHAKEDEPKLTAGWYPHPNGGMSLRRWDGQRWRDEARFTLPFAHKRAEIAPASSVNALAPVLAPTKMTTVQLLEYAHALGHALYWIGDYEGYDYEVTRNEIGEIYIRYLPTGTASGDQSGDYTIIGTHPQAQAYAIVQARVEREELECEDVPEGGNVVWATERPTNVYLVYPDFPFIIEIYDPDSERAMQIALTGEVCPLSAG
jgi:hypothetical protein